MHPIHQTEYDPRQSGGPVKAGGFYRVNEGGAEMLTINGSDYLMMGNSPGRVKHAGMTPNMSGTQINIINNQAENLTG